MVRAIVHIDEEKCDGCGLCIPSCHEGALRIIDGKARLVSDKLCDGLGACLGHCPRGAITIEERTAAEFDEMAVAAARTRLPVAGTDMPASPRSSVGTQGCPGSRLRTFGSVPPTQSNSADEAVRQSDAARSELTHWPVQLGLLPPQAPVLRRARLLIAADCVPVASAAFHSRLLRGRAVLIGCPKFDDLNAYVEKLTAILALNDLQEVVVARMEVPCCIGLVSAVLAARRQAAVTTPVTEVVIGVDGSWQSEHLHELPQSCGELHR
ncbi:MAG: 4Fe-4S binding protein [Phycisphaerales bacterium]|nr:4Fe-4S binding protein [Phycisphaerales bacterium]